MSVYGFDERIPALTHKVEKHETFSLLKKMKVEVHFTPCHTKGHVVYHACPLKKVEEPKTSGLNMNCDVLFSGDTLFVAGCGRFFEGTGTCLKGVSSGKKSNRGRNLLYCYYSQFLNDSFFSCSDGRWCVPTAAEQMTKNLQSIVSNLPLNTLLLPGHEYTLNNLMFAAHVEPGNACIKEKLQWALDRRLEGLPTIPSTLMEEVSYNPFLRLQSPEIRSHLGCDSECADEEVMRRLREAKDNFKGA